MSKPIIAVDIDDVLIESGAQIIADYNRRWGTKLTTSAYYATHDSSAWGADEETAIRRVDDYVLSREFVDRSPIQGVLHSIRALSVHYELHALTGRTDVMSEVTKDWLQKYFPNIFKTVNFSNLYDKDKRRSKGEMGAELGAKFLIDDHLEHLMSAKEFGIQGILFGNYPWNEATELPHGIIRCLNWAKVEEYFSERAS